MVNKNILDNLTSQEIKEMINRNEIILEQLDASTLRKLMDYETDMLCIGEGDVDLICKCSDILDEIEPNPMTSKEFMSIIEQSKREHVTVIDENIKSKGVSKIRFILKRTALIAAIISIIMTSTIAIASAFGLDIYKYIAEIVREPEGAESNVGEFTFYHDGKIKKYYSIQEMIEDNNLDIMYPTKLPDNIYLKSVDMSTNEIGNKLIIFVTNYDSVGITIELSTKDFVTANPNVYEYNGIKFYIEDSDIFVAYCYHNSNSYYITANTKDDLINIIENMKE